MSTYMYFTSDMNWKKHIRDNDLGKQNTRFTKERICKQGLWGIFLLLNTKIFRLSYMTTIVKGLIFCQLVTKFWHDIIN